MPSVTMDSVRPCPLHLLKQARGSERVTHHIVTRSRREGFNDDRQSRGEEGREACSFDEADHDAGSEKHRNASDRLNCTKQDRRGSRDRES